MEFKRNLGSWGGGPGWNKCLFPAGQSGAQTFRLIVSCHCQHETKACDLSMCSTTALKTDAKPQGSGPATLFEGFADGLGRWLGVPPDAVRVEGKGQGRLGVGTEAGVLCKGEISLPSWAAYGVENVIPPGLDPGTQRALWISEPVLGRLGWS